MIPAGNIRTETTTRTEREDAPDTKTRERVETRNSPGHRRSALNPEAESRMPI